MQLTYESKMQVGEAALSILHCMVSAHSDLDDAGEIVTPTPRVKWILSSPRCLPHIAQVINLFRFMFTVYYRQTLFISPVLVSFKGLNIQKLFIHLIKLWGYCHFFFALP